MWTDTELPGNEFGGATTYVQFASKELLVAAVTALLEEVDHKHNFKVAVDGYRLYLSPSALYCITNSAQKEDTSA